MFTESTWRVIDFLAGAALGMLLILVWQAVVPPLVEWWQRKRAPF